MLYRYIVLAAARVAVSLNAASVLYVSLAVKLTFVHDRILDVHLSRICHYAIS